MRVNLLTTMIIFALIQPVTELRTAVSKTTWADAPAREFVFVENSSDDNFFVTPGGALDPRLTGANRWTGSKYTGSRAIYQQSLDYIDDGYNTGLYTSWKFDMWLENSPVSSPLAGLRCINWYAGYNTITSLILPQTTNASGFYGVTMISGSTKWMHGMLSDAFCQYPRQMSAGSSFTMTINACQTSVNYDTSSDVCCKDQAPGNRYTRNVTRAKAANLRLINTYSLAEVLINNDGALTLGEKSVDYRTQTAGSFSGLSCKMVSYTLQISGLSSISIYVFPAITSSSLTSAAGAYDMQLSLNGSSWEPVSNTAYYYTFNEMESADSTYVLFSSNSFKQMVNLGISDINTEDLFSFRFQNTTPPELSWHEFSTSNTLIIRPHDFSISIISDGYTQTPSREGCVGSSESALDFGYIVTASDKTAADEVLIKVTGPTQMIGGRSYCVPSSDDGKAEALSPATLSFITRNGTTEIYDAGRDGSRWDVTDALWLTTPRTDISSEVGQMDKTTVKFSISMNNAISLHTVDGNDWLSEASVSEEIHIQMIWRNIS